MGGGDHGHGFDTRSVWSPAGGWFSDPRGWRRNTAVAFAVIGVLSAGVFNLSRKLEARARVRSHLLAADACRSWRGRGRSRDFAATRCTPVAWGGAPLASTRLRHEAPLGPQLGPHRPPSAAGTRANVSVVPRGALRARPPPAAPPSLTSSVGGLPRPPLTVCAHRPPSPRAQMRPILPVRPIPSQRWCDNFGEKAKLNDD